MSFKKKSASSASPRATTICVRYHNPLLAPPCPPKLLNIPTDPKCYTRPTFLDDIAAGTPLPMVIDGELGMPLDLSHWDCLWDESGDDSEINPDPHNLPKLDPKDQFLLGDPATSSGPFPGAGPSSGTSTPLSAVPHIAWLRKTEYSSRDGIARASLASEVKQNINTTIDVSRDAQLRDIEASFAAVESSELASLQHPTKPELTAVEVFDILPDADIWANTYDLFRFSERPGDHPQELDDPCLDCAILRPMEANGDHFLAYYLTKDDKDVIAFKQSRLARLPNDPPEEEPSLFYFVRDYETVKVKQEVPNEFLLKVSPVRPKGAYYKNIERKMLLKKKCVNTYESLTHIPMSSGEEQEREEALSEVVDPLFLLSRADADTDAEGEVDESAGAPNGTSSRNPIADAIDVFGEK
ncbi:Paf1-domain-containing protein, partial [Lentinus tigrinus ALCF2SS1-6]